MVHTDGNYGKEEVAYTGRLYSAPTPRRHTKQQKRKQFGMSPQDDSVIMPEPPETIRRAIKQHSNYML